MIGASWAALASAHGLSVSAYDPHEAARERFLGHVERARAQLTELGLTGTGAVSFSTDLAAALAGGLMDDSAFTPAAKDAAHR